jgi:hypothetical protein
VLLVVLFFSLNMLLGTEGALWDDKTGISMTAEEIENWTLEGMGTHVLPASALTDVRESCSMCPSRGRISTMERANRTETR